MLKHSEIDYRNKWVLAPMVRACLLPFRLECLKYGADLVWTEEIVDKRIVESVRYENADFDTIGSWVFLTLCIKRFHKRLCNVSKLPFLAEYVCKKDRSLTFSTNSEEKGKVVFQLGACIFFYVSLNVEPAIAVARRMSLSVTSINCNW
jgi:tRNA-dihydrouridine synthase 2